VLEGADHLLLLVTLLLVAPLVAAAGRWRRRDGVVPTLRRVVGVVTACTAGHSLTLIASALDWVSLPATPVEVLIAASVGVAPSMRSVHSRRRARCSSPGRSAWCTGWPSPRHPWPIWD
jgi:HupE / UreJ protein